MTSLACINNRNFRIIATYVDWKLGSHHGLFEGLSFPDKYASAEDFFLNEDEWTTYENFSRVFRRAKEMVNEPDFFFHCGFSAARFQSWGRFRYFVRVFATPNDGYLKVPFFNQNMDDTKDIEVILPPHYDRTKRQMRTILKVTFHDDFDPNMDYIGDPYLRGILAAIPTIWGLRPATIRQPMVSYDPEVLLNDEPEFEKYQLNAKMEGGQLIVRHPETGHRVKVGKKVLLKAETMNQKKCFLGQYAPVQEGGAPVEKDQTEAIAITETLLVGNRILLKEGEIFKAPYHILDISYDRMSIFRRMSQIFKIGEQPKASGEEWIETINRMRSSMMARNKAYFELEKTNEELRRAKERLDRINRELEQRVSERTAELERKQQEVIDLNRHLEEKVRDQVAELKRHDELRRYLSPQLAESILNSEKGLEKEPQRKMLTVVFTDIRGFSNLTDSVEPEEAFHLLDRYLSEMTRIVHHFGGTLNKISGDGLLIFFGDPLPMKNHPCRAVEMAVAMQQKISELKEDWRPYGHELGVGIGINTGFATVGNVGSDMHRDYTVIGNQVNIAARLESSARAGEILISQRTFSQISEAVEAREVGEIQVKGVHHPVTVYSVAW